MSRTYFATEMGMSAMPGVGGEKATKSWRDMTEDDWEAHRAQMRAKNGKTAEPAADVETKSTETIIQADEPESTETIIEVDGLENV